MCNKYIWLLTSVVTVNQVTYVIRSDKFVIKMIVNVDCQYKNIFIIIFF